jgi:hypothetical protein
LQKFPIAREKIAGNLVLDGQMMEKKGFFKYDYLLKWHRYCEVSVSLGEITYGKYSLSPAADL